LPIEIVESRLKVLRSGELAPEMVFSTRIERLDSAVKSLAAQFESDFDPQLTELNESIEKLSVQEKQIESDVESANSKLQDLKRQIEELSSKRDQLDEKVKSLKEKQERYQVTVEALRKGIRVN
jgi:chromosome segregation ATPase